LMPIVNGDGPSWMNSIYLLLALMIITLVLIVGKLKETFKSSTSAS
jgi:hypothetical protein